MNSLSARSTLILVYCNSGMVKTPFFSCLLCVYVLLFSTCILYETFLKLKTPSPIALFCKMLESFRFGTRVDSRFSVHDTNKPHPYTLYTNKSQIWNSLKRYLDFPLQGR